MHSFDLCVNIIPSMISSKAELRTYVETADSHVVKWCLVVHESYKLETKFHLIYASFDRSNINLKKK